MRVEWMADRVEDPPARTIQVVLASTVQYINFLHTCICARQGRLLKDDQVCVQMVFYYTIDKVIISDCECLRRSDSQMYARVCASNVRQAYACA
jgi:hypothetical protein